MRSRSGGLWTRWSGDSGVPGDGMSVSLALETILLTCGCSSVAALVRWCELVSTASGDGVECANGSVRKSWIGL